MYPASDAQGDRCPTHQQLTKRRVRSGIPGGCPTWMSVPALLCSLRSKCRGLPAIRQATMPPKKMAPVLEKFVVFAWMTKDQIESKWIDEGRGQGRGSGGSPAALRGENLARCILGRRRVCMQDHSLKCFRRRLGPFKGLQGLPQRTRKRRCCCGCKSTVLRLTTQRQTVSRPTSERATSSLRG